MTAVSSAEQVRDRLKQGNAAGEGEASAFIESALEWTEQIPRHIIGTLAIDRDLFVFKVAWQFFLNARMEKGAVERIISGILRTLWDDNGFDRNQVRRADMEIVLWKSHYPLGSIRHISASPDDYDQNWGDVLRNAWHNRELLPYFEAGIFDVPLAARYLAHSVDPSLAAEMAGEL